MTNLKSIIKGFFLCNFIWLSSCVKVPIELALDNKIDVDDSEINELRTKILDKLNKEISFGLSAVDPALVRPDVCAKAFSKWLSKQFDNERIPKRPIPSTEYAAGSNVPGVYQCRTVDMEKEFKNMLNKQNSEEFTGDAEYFDLSEFRQKIDEEKCLQVYVKPEKHRFEIIELPILVKTNTLNVHSPRFNIYYSVEKVEKSELKDFDSPEEILINEGKIKLLGTSPAIPPGFTGFINVELVPDLRKAHKFLIPMNTQIISFQQPLKSLEISRIGTEEFFIVPSGKISMQLHIQLSATGNINDAKCFLDEYKDDLRKEDEKRIKEYEKKKKERTQGK